MTQRRKLLETTKGFLERLKDIGKGKALIAIFTSKQCARTRKKPQQLLSGDDKEAKASPTALNTTLYRYAK